MNAEGTLILISSDHAAGAGRPRAPGRYTSRARIPGRMLLEGRYTIELSIEEPRVRDFLAGQTCTFEIDEMGHDGWGPKNAPRLPGVIHLELDWQVREPN